MYLLNVFSVTNYLKNSLVRFISPLVAGVGSTKRTRTGARFASVRERLREVTYFVYKLENTKINVDS